MGDLKDRYLQKLVLPLFLGDLGLFFFAWNFSFFLRFLVFPHFFGWPAESNLYLTYFLSGLLVVLLGSVLFVLLGAYDGRGLHAGQAYYQRLLLALFLSLAIWYAGLFFFRSFSYSRLHALLFIGSSLIFLTCYRFILFKNAKSWVKSRRIVVVGTGALAVQFFENFNRLKPWGLCLVGFLGPDNPHGLQPYLGSDLKQWIDHRKLDEVLLAFNSSESQAFRDLEMALRHEMIDVTWLLALQKDLFVRPEFIEFEGLPALVARQSPLFGLQFWWKRLYDIFCSSFFILCALPLWILLPILIKLSSKGPVIYRQERMGLDGKVFFMYKFRSMHPEAEAQTGAVWAVQDDPRVTKIGKFLRRTSLDEIPQFFNVFKGSMSLVGPRPERPELIEKFKEDIPFYMARHRIKAGITGWAQIHGLRGDTSLAKRIEYDLYYIRHWSLWLDIKICWVTIFKGFIHKNAY